MPGLARARRARLVGGPAAVARELERRLRERGLGVGPAEADGQEGSILIFLEGLSAKPSSSATLDLHKQAFRAAQSMARALKAGDAFVTVQDCGGDFGYGGTSAARAWLGGLPGLVKTAAREWPAVDLKTIDIATQDRDPDEIADLIVKELFDGGPAIEVAYDAAGRRLVPVLREQPLDRLAGLPFSDGDVVVISGGARGVTAAAAIALAEHRRLKLCLLGRSAIEAEPSGLADARDEVGLRQRLIGEATRAGDKPDLPAIRRKASQILATREVTQTLARIRELGSDVRYQRCDVAEAESVQAAIDEVNRDWGTVVGLIHGAGVIADKAIADKTEADFEAVFRTKVDGWANLLGAVDQAALRGVCVFSSVSAKFGNFGQCDYAIANEVLNKQAIAFARANPGCRVKSICWGPWEGGMVDASLKRHFERQGVGMIDLPSGVRAFVEELSSNDGAVEVIVRNGDFLPEETSRMTVRVDAKSYGFLVDHTIEADPVLPMVLVHEWFLRATRARLPQVRDLSVRDLRMLKGIVLEGFPQQEFRFDIELSPAEDEGRLVARLTDEQGRLRYEAAIVRCDADVVAIGATGDAPQWNGAVYREGGLFHGPAFQTIARLEALHDDGGAAIVGSIHERGWPSAGWLSDPAAVDGAIQVAFLWSLERGGGRTLPVRLGACRVLRQARPGQAYECRLRSRSVDAWRSDHDVELLLDGEVAISLSGLEMYRIKDNAPPQAMRAGGEA